MVADTSHIADSNRTADRVLVLHHAAISDGRRPYDELRQGARTAYGE